MIDIFSAKIPITYTEKIIDGDFFIENTKTVGYLFTDNVLATMAFYKSQIKEILKR